MKTIVALLFLLISFNNIIAQCDYNLLVKEGRALFNKQQYRAALKKFNAARTCDPLRTAEVDIEVDRVFEAIEQQKEDEKQSRERAEAQRRRMETARIDMEHELAKADSLYTSRELSLAKAREEHSRAARQQQKGDSLIERGTLLLKTLTRDNDLGAFKQLSDQGYRYFTYDEVRLGRDYRQAGVYFSLAQFVQNDPTIELMIQCANLGQSADKMFYLGEIDSAETTYMRIIRALRPVYKDTTYEYKQIERIKEIRAMMRSELSRKQYGEEDGLVLDGNWWTIPPGLLSSQEIKKITIRNNNVLMRDLPENLLKYTNIEWLTIENCPRFTGISDWGKLTNLSSLTIVNNASLREITFPRGLSKLQVLTIQNNNELVRIKTHEPLESLEEITITNNLLLTEIDSLFEPSVVKELTIQGNPSLSNPPLGIDGMLHLNQLVLCNLPDLVAVEGARRYDDLQYLELCSNPNLKKIRGFSDLPRLETFMLTKNARLKNLNSFNRLPSLKTIEFSQNHQLRSLLNWRHTDSLHKVNITQNSKLHNLGNWKALKKAPVKNLFGGDFLRKYLSVHVSILSDALSDETFSGFIAAGMRYHRQSKEGWWALMPSLDYFHHKGVLTNDTATYLPYFRASRITTNPLTGVETETVRYLNGRSNFDLRYFDMKLLAKFFTISEDEDWEYYALIGPTLMLQIPGKISAEIDGSGVVFSQDIKSRMEIYTLLGGGVSYEWRRSKFFVEIGFHKSLGNVVERNTVRQIFYSYDAVKFDTTPRNNAFKIAYAQPTFDNFLWFTFGASYQLNFFNPYTK